MIFSPEKTLSIFDIRGFSRFIFASNLCPKNLENDWKWVYFKCRMNLHTNFKEQKVALICGPFLLGMLIGVLCVVVFSFMSLYKTCYFFEDKLNLLHNQLSRSGAETVLRLSAPLVSFNGFKDKALAVLGEDIHLEKDHQNHWKLRFLAIHEEDILEKLTKLTYALGCAWCFHEIQFQRDYKDEQRVVGSITLSQFCVLPSQTWECVL